MGTSANLSDIGFEDFMNLYKIYRTKPNSFAVIDTTLSSDDLFPFRCNFLERI